jgi:hypothetical protein
MRWHELASGDDGISVDINPERNQSMRFSPLREAVKKEPVRAADVENRPASIDRLARESTDGLPSLEITAEATASFYKRASAFPRREKSHEVA